MTSFAPFHFTAAGKVMGRLTLVLTPEPKLADIG
jgi:hypothetical protein